jgi:hypothetical protein
VAFGAKVLIGIGKANHAAGAAGTHHLVAGRSEALLDGLSSGQSKILAVVND